MAAAASPPAAAPPPRYALREVIGEGANAVVWRARDTITDREVALKRLRPQLVLEKDWADRMRREARAIAAIRHPGVVRIIEVGQDEPQRDGTPGSPYIVMELLHGPTLAAIARPLAIDRALGIGAAICDALVAVHAAGIVHRDVKAENVMLDGLPSAEARVVLLDFGLARLVDPDATMRATARGTVLGTPFSMSPEQIRGGPAIDGRADVWAVGVLLYELVTGRRPFDGEGTLQVMHTILSRDPDPPSAHVAIDDDAERAILSALAKDPRARPDAAALRDALGPFLREGDRASDSGVRRIRGWAPA